MSLGGASGGKETFASMLTGAGAYDMAVVLDEKKRDARQDHTVQW